MNIDASYIYIYIGSELINSCVYVNVPHYHAKALLRIEMSGDEEILLIRGIHRERHVDFEYIGGGRSPLTLRRAA